MTKNCVEQIGKTNGNLYSGESESSLEIDGYIGETRICNCPKVSRDCEFINLKSEDECLYGKI